MFFTQRMVKRKGSGFFEAVSLCLFFDSSFSCFIHYNGELFVEHLRIDQSIESVALGRRAKGIDH